MLYWIRHAVLICFLSPIIAQAQILENDSWRVSDQADMWVDTEARANLSQVLIGGSAIDWQIQGSDERSLGFTDAAVWLRMPINRPAWADNVWYLSSRYALLDEVSVYLVDPSGQVVFTDTTSRRLPLAERPVAQRGLHLRVEVPEGESVVYIRIASHSALKPRLDWVSSSTFAAHSERASAGYALLYGAMLMAVFIYVLLGCVMRIWSLVPIGLYFAAGSIWQSVMEGSLALLWPAHWSVPIQLTPFLLFVMAVLVQSYNWILRLERASPLRSFDGVIAGWLVAGLVLAWWMPYELATRLSIITNFASWSLLAFSTLRADQEPWIKRVAVLASVVIYLGGGALIALDTIGAIYIGAFASMAYMITSVPQVMLLTFGGVWVAREQSIRNKQIAQELAEQTDLAASARQASYQAERKFASEVQMMRADLAVIRDESSRDPLTGLPNRASLDRYLKAISSKPIASLSVLVLDLDHFKRLNDSYGHAVGDDALVSVAKVLDRQLGRLEDFVGRYGGEEFIVVLPEAGLLDAESVAERLLSQIRAIELYRGSLPVAVTASVGVASYVASRDGKFDFDKVFEAADKALYNAKTRGRDQASVVPQLATLEGA